MMAQSCCTPSTGMATDLPHIKAVEAIVPAGPEVTSGLKAQLVQIPGGSFDMGTDNSRYPQDLDSPRRPTKVDDFLISPFALSNREFARFVDATGYKTVAEREGWSFVFHLFLRHPEQYQAPPGLPWWRTVEGADWSAPEGPESSVAERGDHPAVHISWYDAVAYCRWAGMRLPRETEWEYAARGGLEHAKFPWGDDLVPDGAHAMNTWQGEFPNANTIEDGYLGTAPVDAFSPNGFGLYNMTGNVWEWAADQFAQHRRAPTGPIQSRTQRGGSYLCHQSYCERYHVYSRTQGEPDSSAGHSGFRIAADKPQ